MYIYIYIVDVKYEEQIVFYILVSFFVECMYILLYRFESYMMYVGICRCKVVKDVMRKVGNLVFKIIWLLDIKDMYGED